MTSSDEQEHSRHSAGQSGVGSADSRDFERLAREVLIQVIALAAAIVILVSIWLLARPIAILLASIIIAAAVAPLAQQLERWLPRPLSVVAVYAALVVVAVALFVLIGATIASEFASFIENAPDRLQEARDWINRRDPFGNGRIIEQIRSQGSQANGMLASIPFMVASTLVEIVIAFFMSLYWLIAAPSIRQFVLSLFSNEDRRAETDELIANVGQTMGGYVRSIIIDGTILTIVTYIGLLIIGLDFALVLAIISGLSVLVPVIGPIVAAIPALLIGFIDSPITGLIVLAFYIGVQQLESNILLPNIMRREADIPPLLGVFAVFAGGSIGGILGALIAVPLAGGLRVVVLQVIAPAIRSR